MDITDISGKVISKAIISFSQEFLIFVILQPQLFFTKTKIPRLSEGVPCMVNFDKICLLFLVRDASFCWSRWWSTSIRISLFVLMMVLSFCSSRSVPIFMPRMFVVHIRIFDRFLFPESGFIVLSVCVGCGREALLHAGRRPDGGHDGCVKVQERRGVRNGGS